jgi:hypothetical protein
MDKQHFKDLVELVRDDLPGGSELSRKRQKAAGGNPISAEIQLSMTLRYLAGGSYLDICRLHRVPNGSFRMVIKRTVRAIVTVLNDKELVAFPIDDPEKLQRIADGYSAGSSGVINRCVGSLDGIAIRIRKPINKYAPKKYFCRKG